MHWLPPLPYRGDVLRLPLREASAATIIDAVLAAERAAAVNSLAAVLGDDPPLLAWTCGAMLRAEAPLPGSVEDAAAWLADHAVQVLQWPAGSRDDAHTEGPTEDARRRVGTAWRARALHWGEAAARAAATPEASAAARLLALVRGAEPWMAASGGNLLRDLKRGFNASFPAARDVVESVAPHDTLPPCELGDHATDGSEARSGGATPASSSTTSSRPSCLPALMQRLGRLAALEDDLRTAVEEEKLAALAEFAAGAGHEINNPLGVIAGRAQLLLSQEADPERQRTLALISAQAMRVHEMIADLRHFARPPVPQRERCDAASLVDEVAESFAPIASSHGIRLRVGGDRAAPLRADPAQLSVALRAVVRNAVEALADGGTIEIALRRLPGWVRIEVADDGPGMQPEERRHALEPYYSARQAGRGLGLGLSKAWRIVTAHGGRLRIEPPRGPGCRVVLEIPEDGAADSDSP